MAKHPEAIKAQAFIDRLERQGLIVLLSDGAYHLTEKGKALAEQFRLENPMREQKVEAA